MRRTVLMGVAAIAPLVGLALVARPAMSAEPPENPPKSTAPKDVAPPKDSAPPKQQPRDAASPRDAAPRNDQPKDVAPRNDQPKDVAPKDNSPRPNAGKDARDVTPPPAAKNPPNNASNPRNAAPNARDDIPNARETKPNARETIPNARDSAPTARDTIPNARDPRARDPRETARDTARDPRARDSATTARDANRDPRATARDVRREHRSTRDLGITFGRVNDRGLAVSDLAATSMLYRSGLRSGDYIVSINGHRLERPEDFDRWVYAVDNDDRIKVIVWRDGREEVVYVEPTVFYADESYNDDYTSFGVVFDDRYPDRLIVLRVYPDTPAFIAGLRAGDEITTWHGQRVATPQEFGRLIQRIEPGVVDFEIARDSKTIRAVAKFNERVATKPTTHAAPNSDARDPAANPGPAAAPSPDLGPAPAPGPGTSPAPAPGPAPAAPPAVRPNPPGTPVPAPNDPTAAPRRPGLLRGR
jgi:PDZ domain